MRYSAARSLFVLITVFVLDTSVAAADELHVAVAANFSSTLAKLSKVFAASTGHTIVPSSGSTGQLTTQITAGAPFDIFLSADADHPRELEDKGLAVKGSRFVYARGRLVLWSPKPGFVDEKGKVLQSKKLGIVAIADPRTAPYGAAAERVLRARKIWDVLDKDQKLSIASSVTQAYQFAATAAASCGFVALSQVLATVGEKGSQWIVPVEESGPLEQEAALLTRAKDSVAAQGFLTFLRTDSRARDIVKADGYELPAVAP